MVHGETSVSATINFGMKTREVIAANLAGTGGRRHSPGKTKTFRGEYVRREREKNTWDIVHWRTVVHLEVIDIQKASRNFLENTTEVFYHTLDSLNGKQIFSEHVHSHVTQKCKFIF